MFGISWAELIVILLVAVVVVPARMWPDVARGVARAVKFVRRIIWKITDVGEELQKQIELEKPIDELIHTTTDDMLDAISTPVRRRKQSKKSGHGRAAK